MSNSDILRGHTETIISKILLDGDNYGYEIAKTITELGNGIIDVKDATIYTAFRRMEQEGYLATYWGDVAGGARRRYYKITETGKDFYFLKAEEWKKVSKILSNLILGDS